MKFVLIFCLVIVATLAQQGVNKSPPSITDAVNQIQCEVCKGSVKHSWREAVKHRAYCQEHRDESKGCARSSSTRGAVLDIMEKSCKFILDHFRIIRTKDTQYRLEAVHDESEATPEPWQKTAVEKACHHGLLNNREGDRYERILHANVEAGKTEGTILPNLQTHLCEIACNRQVEFSDSDEL